VILVDTSAWVEFLQGTGSAADREVERLLDGELAVTEPILMEVLAGARSDAHLRQLRALLGRADLVPILGTDYTLAAGLYRTCRQNGDTVRKLLDCLIGAVAVRTGLPLLHADQDFDALERWTGLTVHPHPDV